MVEKQPPHHKIDFSQEPQDSDFVAEPELRSFQDKYEILTPAEQQVLFLITDGKDQNQIAKKLGITIKTVQTHFNNIHRKSKVSKNQELARLYAAMRERQRQSNSLQSVPESSVSESELIEFIQRFNTLTKIERHILKYLAQGYTHESVADNLQIKIKTVDTHVADIHKKLGVRKQTKITNLYITMRERAGDNLQFLYDPEEEETLP